MDLAVYAIFSSSVIVCAFTVQTAMNAPAVRV